MSTQSEKAADKIHADLSALRDTARRYAGLANGALEFHPWHDLAIKIDTALKASTACMSERDRRIAAQS